MIQNIIVGFIVILAILFVIKRSIKSKFCYCGCALARTKIDNNDDKNKKKDNMQTKYSCCSDCSTKNENK
jgi:hypothetical protein